MHRQIGRDRDGQKYAEGRQRPLAGGKNQLAEGREDTRRHRPNRGGNQVERQQHPQKPGRTRRPWSDAERAPPEVQEVEIRRSRQVIAQECWIIGDRHQHEDRDQKRHAQSPGTVAQEVSGSPARQAVTNEQSRNEKHAGHEEAVIEQHDQIESEPAHPIAIAEISVIDDRVVQQHQQRDKSARAVQRNDAFRCHHSPTVAIGFPQHHISNAS